MDKKETNYLIFIGLALVGLGYFIYKNDKKKQSANLPSANTSGTQTNGKGNAAVTKQTVTTGSQSNTSQSGNLQDFPNYSSESNPGFKVGYYDGHTNFIIS